MDAFCKLMTSNFEGRRFRDIDYIKEPDKEYQVFEVLVVDVLKRWARGLQWEVTPVQGDGGIDFIGGGEPIRLGLWGGMVIDWRIVGQVKCLANARREN